jgi:hypothetical protein
LFNFESKKRIQNEKAPRAATVVAAAAADAAEATEATEISIVSKRYNWQHVVLITQFAAIFVVLDKG